MRQGIWADGRMIRGKPVDVWFSEFAQHDMSWMQNHRGIHLPEWRKHKPQYVKKVVVSKKPPQRAYDPRLEYMMCLAGKRSL